MADLFGVKLSAAAIARMSRACAKRRRGFAETPRGLVAARPATTWTRPAFASAARRNAWTTALLAFYRVVWRGRLPANAAGIGVHDRWKPFSTMQAVLHALCNAHHLRELKALADIAMEDFAGKLPRFLRRACPAANLAWQRGVLLRPGLVELFERGYAVILGLWARLPAAKGPSRPPRRKDDKAKRGGRAAQNRTPSALAFLAFPAARNAQGYLALTSRCGRSRRQH